MLQFCVKGRWRRIFLLPLSKITTNVITNMVIIFYQTVWLARYLDFFLLHFEISSAILKKLSFWSHDLIHVISKVRPKQQFTFV